MVFFLSVDALLKVSNADAEYWNVSIENFALPAEEELNVNCLFALNGTLEISSGPSDF